MAAPKFQSKKPQQQNKPCYFCNKTGHTQSKCKDKEANRDVRFGSGRQILDPELIEKPYLLNTIVAGIPNEEGLNLAKVIKVLMEPWKINCTQYEVSRAHPDNPARDNEVRLKFMDRDTKNKFYRSSYHNLVEFGNVPGGYNFHFGDQIFTVQFRDDVAPDIDEVYSKAIELRETFDGVTVNFYYSGEKVCVKRNSDYWLLESVKDVSRMNYPFKVRKNSGNHSLKQGQAWKPSKFWL